MGSPSPSHLSHPGVQLWLPRETARPLLCWGAAGSPNIIGDDFPVLPRTPSSSSWAPWGRDSQPPAEPLPRQFPQGCCAPRTDVPTSCVAPILSTGLIHSCLKASWRSPELGAGPGTASAHPPPPCPGGPTNSLGLHQTLQSSPQLCDGGPPHLQTFEAPSHFQAKGKLLGLAFEALPGLVPAGLSHHMSAWGSWKRKLIPDCPHPSFWLVGIPDPSPGMPFPSLSLPSEDGPEGKGEPRGPWLCLRLGEGGCVEVKELVTKALLVRVNPAELLPSASLD